MAVLSSIVIAGVLFGSPVNTTFTGAFDRLAFGGVAPIQVQLWNGTLPFGSQYLEWGSITNTGTTPVSTLLPGATITVGTQPPVSVNEPSLNWALLCLGGLSLAALVLKRAA